VAHGIHHTEVVPLGIDLQKYPTTSISLEDPCVFLTAGRFVAAGVRKNVAFALEAFQRAFTDGQSAKLLVKCFPDCDVPAIQDPRVEVIQAHFPEDEFIRLLQSCTALFLPSMGEAWSLIAQQGAVLGRPSVLPLHGGPLMFLDAACTFPIDFDLVDSCLADYRGDLVQPRMESACAQLRQVYEQRRSALLKGLYAAQKASVFTVQRMIHRIVELLLRYNYVSFNA
jgi:glycosyltransferase involved in cell wall biosynthesis